MNKLLLLIFSLLLQPSCIDKKDTSKTNILPAKQMDSQLSGLIDTLPKPPKEPESTFDNSILLFGDTSYRLTLHIFDTKSYDEEKNNATLTFGKCQNGQTRIFFKDSLYCMYPEIDIRDFNNDKKKDVLVFHYTGARANPTYHLYLSDPKNHTLTYVKGFEDLPNPGLDSVNNIITSIALYGGNVGYSFYRINSKNKLVNLKHSFEADLNDSTKYDKAIRQILMKRK